MSKGLKRRNVVLMIAFTLITLGFYYPLWFLRRRRALNQLDSPRKLRLWPFVLAAAFFVVSFVVGFAAAPGTVEQTFGQGPALLLSIIELGVGILLLVQCFIIKDILEDHLAGPEDAVATPLMSRSASLSGLATFFFQIYYLQHVINREIVDPQSTPA